ncbi:unnamed protein product [Trichogramma brassicae]|uniref:Uncharacterized protein n=1 Tax=Trichogramma brassicae TaxID=86971 RepID=A0A6H5I8P5_9HYME|nr:unnamed protein product [Trichogramma brassicae]
MRINVRTDNPLLSPAGPHGRVRRRHFRRAPLLFQKFPAEIHAGQARIPKKKLETRQFELMVTRKFNSHDSMHKLIQPRAATSTTQTKAKTPRRRIDASPTMN